MASLFERIAKIWRIFEITPEQAEQLAKIKSVHEDKVDDAPRKCNVCDCEEFVPNKYRPRVCQSCTHDISCHP